MPLQPGLRFFCIPLPAAPSAFLTVGFASSYWRCFGLTTFRMFNAGSLGPLSSPGALLVHERSFASLYRLRCPFGTSLLLHLRLAVMTTFIERSHMLAMLPNPGPIPAALSERRFPREFRPCFSAVRLCQGSCHKRPLPVSHVPLGYCRWNGRSCPLLRQDN
jgi:hypothetical protein